LHVERSDEQTLLWGVFQHTIKRKANGVLKHTLRFGQIRNSMHGLWHYLTGAVRAEDLNASWLRLAHQVGGGTEAVAEQWYVKLSAAYIAPDRRYHTLEHVRQVVSICRNLTSKSDERLALELTAWFHDYIYDPKRRDNEERSAEAATAAIDQLGGSGRLGAQVAEMIALTKTHESNASPLGDMFLDADLTILAAPPEQYEAYAAGIREEYAWVTDREFRSGRSAVLEGLLKRPKMFHTAMCSALEENARTNLKNELEKLKAVSA
jgi:predicted metal-dependent HD superfamily phosphohydrolase